MKFDFADFWPQTMIMITYKDLVNQARELWSTGRPMILDVTLSEFMELAGWSSASVGDVTTGNLSASVSTIYGPISLHIIEDE